MAGVGAFDSLSRVLQSGRQIVIQLIDLRTTQAKESRGPTAAMSTAMPAGIRETTDERGIEARATDRKCQNY